MAPWIEKWAIPNASPDTQRTREPCADGNEPRRTQMRSTMLKYDAGPIAIVMIFALGLALVGLGVDMCLVDRETPARTLRLDGPERAAATAGAAPGTVEPPGGLVLDAEEIAAIDLRRGIRPSP